MLRIIALAFALLTISGCKVAVVAPEGGVVRSETFLDCEDKICYHEITDATFDATFEAVPDPGWYFEKWQTGENFFCVPKTNPVCVVTSVGTAGIPEIEAIIASDSVYYVQPIFKRLPTTAVYRAPWSWTHNYFLKDFGTLDTVPFRSCWSRDSLLRPTFAELQVKNDWMGSVKREDLAPGEIFPDISVTFWCGTDTEPKVKTELMLRITHGSTSPTDYVSWDGGILAIEVQDSSVNGGDHKLTIGSMLFNNWFFGSYYNTTPTLNNRLFWAQGTPELVWTRVDNAGP